MNVNTAERYSPNPTRPNQTQLNPTNTKVTSWAYAGRNAYVYGFSKLMEREHASVRMWNEEAQQLAWTGRKNLGKNTTNKSGTISEQVGNMHMTQNEP